MGFEPEQVPTALNPTFFLGFCVPYQIGRVQEVRRESASGERFSGFPAAGQSTSLPRKPQETCQSARRSNWRRTLFAFEMAEEVRLGTGGLQAGAWETRHEIDQ